MFLDFLLFLRAGGLKVTLHDWLSLVEGLQMGLHGQTLRGFFILCRTLLVKKEADMDRFEELFYQFFKEVASDELLREMEALLHDPEQAERIFAEYMEKKDMDPQTMIASLKKRMAEEGGSDGTLQYGSDGAVAGKDKMGFSAGPGAGSGDIAQGAGGRSVVHARGDRRFRDWRTDCTIESRQFQMAFRLLRELSRKLQTNEEELDVRGTIDHTCRQGGILDIRMQPPRRNRLKLMMLIDSGGSMQPYEQLCSQLFQSLYKANTFSDLKIYYFHNCLESCVYRTPHIDMDDTVDTDWVLRNISEEYRVIFVGDADMAIHELKNGSEGSWTSTAPDGITWFRRFRDQYEHSIWLHPQERDENVGTMSESFAEIGRVFPMFRLSIDGLKDGMYKLMKNG